MAGDLGKRPAHLAGPQSEPGWLEGRIQRLDRWLVALGATMLLGGVLWFAVEVVSSEGDGGWFGVVRNVAAFVMIGSGIIAWLLELDALGFEIGDD
jgi:hypothetical protein